jgi:hypothetical protein
MHFKDLRLNLNEQGSNGMIEENGGKGKQKHQSRLCSENNCSSSLIVFLNRFCSTSYPFATRHSIHAELMTYAMTLIASFLFYFLLHESSS